MYTGMVGELFSERRASKAPEGLWRCRVSGAWSQSSQIHRSATEENLGGPCIKSSAARSVGQETIQPAAIPAQVPHHPADIPLAIDLATIGDQSLFLDEGTKMADGTLGLGIHSVSWLAMLADNCLMRQTLTWLSTSDLFRDARLRERCAGSDGYIRDHPRGSVGRRPAPSGGHRRGAAREWPLGRDASDADTIRTDRGPDFRPLRGVTHAVWAV